MDDLKGMVIFYHVIEAGSFSGAARRLDLAKSAVSRHVARLERGMGARLLNRTTRKLSLTEAGESFYRSCARIVCEAEAAKRSVSGYPEALAGTLRVSCPVALGSGYLAPLAKAFADRYPELTIELLVDDRIVDMVEERVDVAVRIGWLADSQLVARRLLDSPRWVCASPEYLRRHGTPAEPEDLAGHEWIVFTLLPTPHRQTLSRAGVRRVVHVNGRFRTNNALLVRSLLLEGAGIGVLAQFMIGDDVRNGRLVRLFPQHDAGDAGVYAVYPERRYLPRKTRLFIDFLSTALRWPEPATAGG